VSFHGSYPSCTFLIGHGADTMAWTNDGESPLYYMASTCGSVELALFLIEHGADPSGTTMGGLRYMRHRLVESCKSRASSSSAVRTRQYDITRGGYVECGMGRGKSSSDTRPHRAWREHYTVAQRWMGYLHCTGCREGEHIRLTRTPFKQYDRTVQIQPSAST